MMMCVRVIGIREEKKENDQGAARRSHGSSNLFPLLFHIICGLPRFLVLVEEPFADEHREEADCSDVNDNPGDLDAKVHAD